MSFSDVQGCCHRSCHRGHLGYRNRIIEAILNLHVVAMLPTRPLDYKNCMLNSAEHEISTAHKNLTTKTFLALSLSEFVFIMLINVKMPTIVGLLTFISSINFVEHEKSFITLEPGFGSI